MPNLTEWIPAEESDPKDSQLKLVSVIDYSESPPYEFVGLGMRMKWWGGWSIWRAGWQNTRETDMEVVAWMNLPEPYGGKNHGND